MPWCRLLARDHAAPESTLALSKADQPCCGRVRPLAWCSRPRNSAALPAGAPMNDVLLVVVIVVALGFDFTNGFHDTANAVATSVSTRALSPRLAVLIASVANIAGAFATTAVAKTVGKGIIDTGLADDQTVLAALLGAIAWNLLTW